MSRRLMAVLLSGTMVLGSIAPQFNAALAAPAQHSEGKNVPPLQPAGAATIREAQGLAGNELWVIAGFIGVFALLWIIDSGNDHDGVPDFTPTTGTN